MSDIPTKIRVCVRDGKDNWIGIAYSSAATDPDKIHEFYSADSVERLREALENMVCCACGNRIGCNDWPTQYGNWKTCASCKAARFALADPDSNQGEEK